jgi:hypothetical protein
MVSRLRFGLWRRFSSWLKGVLDARRGQRVSVQPASSDTSQLLDAEQQFVDITNGCIQTICERGEKKKGHLEGKSKSLAVRVAERESHLHESAREYGTSRASLEGYLKADTKNGKSAVIPRSQLGWRTYMVLMSVIGVGEGAFNFVVFQVFQENLPFTFLMSLAVMVGMPALGHYGGMSTRHKKYALGWVWIVIGLVALAGITYLRVMYLKSEATPSDTTPVITTRAMGVAYFCISVLIFAVAVAVAFFYHEPDEQLDGLKKDKEEKEQRWRKELRRYRRTQQCFLEMLGPIDGNRTYVARTTRGTQEAGKELLHIYRRAYRKWLPRSASPWPFGEIRDGLFARVPAWAADEDTAQRGGPAITNDKKKRTIIDEILEAARNDLQNAQKSPSDSTP